jgi:hypothetical protein
LAQHVPTSRQAASWKTGCYQLRVVQLARFMISLLVLLQAYC